MARAADTVQPYFTTDPTGWPFVCPGHALPVTVEVQNWNANWRNITNITASELGLKVCTCATTRRRPQSCACHERDRPPPTANLSSPTAEPPESNDELEFCFNDNITKHTFWMTPDFGTESNGVVPGSSKYLNFGFKSS